MKPILPSLREKKRYLVYEVETDKKVDFKALTTEIQSSVKALVGELGLAKTGLIALPNWQNNRGILRIVNKEVDTVKAALTLVKEINGEKVIIKSIMVSGLLDKAKAKLKKEA